MNSIIQMDADLHQAGSPFGFFDLYHFVHDKKR